MKKQAVAAALALGVIGASAIGFIAYAQTPTPTSTPTSTQMEPASPTYGSEAKGTEADGPGGHEDPQGVDVDHQFDGIE